MLFDKLNDFSIKRLGSDGAKLELDDVCWRTPWPESVLFYFRGLYKMSAKKTLSQWVDVSDRFKSF